MDSTDTAAMRDHLKRTFGTAAAQYHRARPGYPAELVAAVLADDASGARPSARRRRMLEVGCGSGQATKDFVGHATELVAVDISADLIAIAERELAGPGLRFVVGPFEDVAIEGSAFDLLLSAQSFHWIDLARGWPRVDELLVAGGRIALFWTFVRFEGSELLHRVRTILLEHAPQFDFWPDSSDARYLSYGGEWQGELDGSGLFTAARVSSFDGSIGHTSVSFCDWLQSLSWFRALPEEGRSALLRDVGSVLPDEGTFEVPRRSLLVCADKRSR
jgi:SAM-dependent methyltransferase